ncbi:MAG: DUF202 domain-containing protein [Candidatus Peregrinibacteria bacterium]|nr:DUF202 domain-containing protein [Candidatus Peregrinibacteria bacterium]
MVYKYFKKENLILRDYLAIDRTILSNESSLLSYFRTALALFVTGVSLIKFFDDIIIIIIGSLFIPVGFYTMMIGIWRYREINKNLRDLRKIPGRESLIEAQLSSPLTRRVKRTKPS